MENNQTEPVPQGEREQERRRIHDEARAAAQTILDAATPATADHPYLKRKGVKAYPGVMVGLWPQRQADNCLLIPLRTSSGPLATVQAILPAKAATGRDKAVFTQPLEKVKLT